MWFLSLDFIQKELPNLCLASAVFGSNAVIDFWVNSAGITEGFSMCGGDFVEVYSDPGQEGKYFSFLFLNTISLSKWMVLFNLFYSYILVWTSIKK